MSRLLWLDAQVRGGAYPATRDLCAQFGIAERTAYEDVAFLRQVLHAPLAYRRRHGGYVYDNPAWQFPAPFVTPQHAAAWEWLLGELERQLGADAAGALLAGFVQRLQESS